MPIAHHDFPAPSVWAFWLSKSKIITLRTPWKSYLHFFPCHHSCSGQCLNLTVDYHKWSAVIYSKSTYGPPTVSPHSHINLLTQCTLLSVSEFSSATTHFNHCMLALMEAREGNMHMALLSGDGYLTDLISLYHTLHTLFRLYAWYYVNLKWYNHLSYILHLMLA